MPTADALGCQARIAQLVKGIRIAKTDRVGIDWFPRQLGHESGDGGGVSTAAEECSDWHVGKHLPANRRLDSFPQIRDKLTFSLVEGTVAIDLPSTLETSY